MHKDKRKKRLARKQSVKAKKIQLIKRYLLHPLPTMLNKAFLI